MRRDHEHLGENYPALVGERHRAPRALTPAGAVSLFMAATVLLVVVIDLGAEWLAEVVHGWLG